MNNTKYYFGNQLLQLCFSNRYTFTLDIVSSFIVYCIYSTD